MERLKNYLGFIAVILVSIAVITIAIRLAGTEGLKGEEASSEYQVLVTSGNANRLVALPNAYVNANSTTTNASLEFSGTVKQLLISDGIKEFTIYAQLKGGTATSTFGIRPLVSNDCSNYYYINSTSTPVELNATTTLSVDRHAYQVDPGTATTSKTWTINIPASECVRLQFWGEDVATDPNDGVKAKIEVSWNK